MTHPETPFEQVSYDLNKLRERRMAERRAVQRPTGERRVAGTPQQIEDKQLDLEGEPTLPGNLPN